MENLSELVPGVEGTKINFKTWDEHTSYEHKWELWNGIPFCDDGIERDKLSMCLIYSMGLKHFLKILPVKSKQHLFELLKEQQD